MLVPFAGDDLIVPRSLRRRGSRREAGAQSAGVAVHSLHTWGRAKTMPPAPQRACPIIELPPRGRDAEPQSRVSEASGVSPNPWTPWRHGARPSVSLTRSSRRRYSAIERTTAWAPPSSSTMSCLSTACSPHRASRPGLLAKVPTPSLERRFFLAPRCNVAKRQEPTAFPRVDESDLATPATPPIGGSLAVTGQAETHTHDPIVRSGDGDDNIPDDYSKLTSHPGR